MNDHLKERIARAVESLSDERGYQVLDYIEFITSKYGERANPDNVFTRITDKVEDTLRAGKVPLDAISGTVSFFDGASKVMRGLASAAQSVVDEAARAANSGMAEGRKGATTEGPKGERAEGWKGETEEGRKGERAEGLRNERAEGQKGETN